MIIDDQIRALVSALESTTTPLAPQQIKSTLQELIQKLQANCEKNEVRQRYIDYAKELPLIDPAAADLSGYPIDADGYAHAFDVLQDEAQIWDAWSKYGVVVNKNVIDQNLVNKSINRIHGLAYQLSKNEFLINEPKTHKNIPRDPNDIPIISRGFLEVYQDDSLAQLRQALRVYLHHVILWGRTDLWTTFDRYGVKLPGNPDSAALPLHVDQNPTTHPAFRTVQGVLALTDCPAERGTLVVVPASKTLFGHYTKCVKNDYRGDYVQLDLQQSFAQTLTNHAQAIPLRAGDFASWDSRNTHANTKNSSGETRLVAYIAAGPAPEFSLRAQDSRMKAYNNAHTIVNYPEALIRKSTKPRFNDQNALTAVRHKEKLSPLGELLYGFKLYNRPWQSEARLLVNAEAFGFGPTAAIADFFPLLRQNFKYIAFVGPKHTLDLQQKLAYNNIYNMDDMSEEAQKKLIDDHDVVFTAFDFKFAKMARELGKPAIIYDSITFFWEKIPEILRESNIYYIAQEFFGVRERITKEYSSFANPKIVPPLLQKNISTRPKDCVLINLGGIKNPDWTDDDVVNYAKIVIDAVNRAVPASTTVIIAASSVVKAGVGDPRIKTFTREEMQELLPRVKYAAITPGLSNIYDMAHHNIPTLYLPPANDSQWMQADLMVKNHMVDANIDWQDLGLQMNYQAPQQDILKQIVANIKSFKTNSELSARLTNLCVAQLQNISKFKGSKANAVVERFGTGGIEQVVEAVRKIVNYAVPHPAVRVEENNNKKLKRSNSNSSK